MKTTFLGKIIVPGILGILLLCPSLVPTGSSSSCPPVSEEISTVVSSNDTQVLTVPDGVEIGDMMLCDLTLDQSNPWKLPGPYNEHSAIYIGNNTLIEANGVVRYRNYTQFSQWVKNYAFIRVKTATEEQRRAAAEWAKSKIGYPYQVFFDFPWFGIKIANTSRKIPTADEIYCVELLWAAYYNQGIDIDRNGWRPPWWLTPYDILYDDDIEVLLENVTNSTEITQPDKGLYIGDKKMLFTIFHTTVIGPIDIIATTENELITQVDFYIDNVYKATTTEPPYTWRWSEKGSGEREIKVIMYDDAGHHYSSKITVRKIL
jgi:Permuted papain-like amidase enzyme, YaeF/YiiX, C92 family/Bacterial Ig domain